MSPLWVFIIENDFIVITVNDALGLGNLSGCEFESVLIPEAANFDPLHAELVRGNTDPQGDGAIVRLDIVGNPIPAHRSPSNYFNASAFAPTPAGAARIGNAGVGILEGPGTIAMSAGLSKVMAIREGLRMRFEATFTNVLNHTNYAPPPDLNIEDAQFGKLGPGQTAENAGNRTGQLALRFDF